MNKTSRLKLESCHQNIIRLAIAVNNLYSIQCICGERDEKAQDHAFKNGMSKKKFPNSKHNVNKEEGRIKSHAADFVPDPDENSKTLDWNDIEEFERMCLVFEQVADELDIKIRLGRDFSFKDMPHIELIT